MILESLCLYIIVSLFFFFFKQKTAYEMRISDWSSDVCSSDLKGGILTWGLARSGGRSTRKRKGEAHHEHARRGRNPRPSPRARFHARHTCRRRHAARG